MKEAIKLKGSPVSLFKLQINAKKVHDEQSIQILKKDRTRDFPGGAVVKNLPANAGDTGSSPGPGRSHMPRSN